MKKFLTVALLVAAFFIVGCGSDETATNKTSDGRTIGQKFEKPAVPVNVIREKLKELSAGLDVRVDDMKEVTYYYCPTDHGHHPPIWIKPYVVVDKDYKASLRQDILYVGNEPLYFNKLFIKTSSGVETFKYPKTVKSYAGEEYVGLMTSALHKKLQEVIDEGGAKFRLEGRTFGEREFKPKEIANMKKVFAIYELLSTVKVEQ